MAVIETFETKATQVEGHVMLIHGMNTSGNAFEDLIDHWNQRAYTVWLLRLKGHISGSYEEMISIVPTDWMQDVEAAYRQLYASNTKQLPIVGVGHSLGGLMHVLFHQQQSVYSADRLVLLAPALETQWYIILIKMLSVTMPKHWGIKTRAPQGYPVLDKVSYAAYKSLFQNMKSSKKMTYKQVPPVQAFIDPKDELVSSSYLKKMNRRYPQVFREVIELDVEPAEKENRYHHLIIDKKSMSKERWSKMWSSIDAFITT